MVKNLRVLFFGTPSIAVPYLEWLHKHTTVVGTVCRPDEPVGRGYAITPPPTKVFAIDNGIPVVQPHGPWTEETIESFRALKADVGVIVAYGRLLPKSIFSSPRLGCVNIHFSLLPKYRGAAPMQWALIRGEKTTGVTTFWLDEGLDDGAIADQRSLAIDPADDIVLLREKLVPLGIASLEKVITDAANNISVREPQKGDSTLAPQLKKEDGRIDWSKTASEITNLVRGVREWPGAATKFTPKNASSKQLKIILCSVEPDAKQHASSGVVLEADKNGIVVSAGRGSVRLIKVQPEGKKEMGAWDFWQGARLSVGDTLG